MNPASFCKQQILEEYRNKVRMTPKKEYRTKPVSSRQLCYAIQRYDKGIIKEEKMKERKKGEGRSKMWYCVPYIFFELNITHFQHTLHKHRAGLTS